MSTDSVGTDVLLQRASLADGSALSRLLVRHRLRLRQLVAARLDPRLAARVDTSDVVQETLADAFRRMPEYLRDRPMPYWAWLRRLALQRVVWWRRFHLVSMKRSVAREQANRASRSDMSTLPGVDQLSGGGTSPSEHFARDQERTRISRVLDSLAAADRQILELRYVEDLSFAQIATLLNLGLSAIKMRHLRALERLRGLAGGRFEEFVN